MFMACFSVGVVETCSLALGKPCSLVLTVSYPLKLMTAAPLNLPSEDIGAALGALGSIRSGGAAVGTAIFVTVLNNKLADFVPAQVTPAALSAGLPEPSLPALFTALAAGDLTTVPGINAAITAAVGAANSAAAADAFRYVWYAVLAFAVFALAASCFTIDYGVYLTDTVERKLHGKTVESGHRDAKVDEKV